MLIAVRALPLHQRGEVSSFTSVSTPRAMTACWLSAKRQGRRNTGSAAHSSALRGSYSVITSRKGSSILAPVIGWLAARYQEAVVTAIDASTGKHSLSQPLGNPFPLVFPEEQHKLDTETEWLIRGLIRRGSLISISALPGSFKSFLILDAALCVANGKDEFLGFAIEQNGPTLIVCADDGVKTGVR